MKTFVAIFVIFGISIYVNAQLIEEIKQKIAANAKECITETGVDTELIKQARQGTFSDDPILKTFAFCMSKKSGFQNEAGEVQTDVLRTKLSQVLNSPEKANELIEKCLKKEKTPEDTAFETYKCYQITSGVNLL